MHDMSLSDENLIIDCPPCSEAAPVVVGGMGGSGTRVIAQLLQSLGFDMGSDLNESLDDLSFTALFKRPSLWPLQDHLPQLDEALDLYLTGKGQKSASWTSQADHEERIGLLLDSIRGTDEWIEAGELDTRMGFLNTPSAAKQKWGWKEPNTHVVLPFLLAALPNMKYIHVTRHGLDMAYSSNQTQLKVWGPHFLQRPVEADSADESLAFWCAVHERLTRLRQLGETQIFILPFESLFENADLVLTRLCNFLGEPEALKAALTAMLTLQKPNSIGRYRDHPPLRLGLNERTLLSEMGYRIEDVYDSATFR